MNNNITVKAKSFILNIQKLRKKQHHDASLEMYCDQELVSVLLEKGTLLPIDGAAYTWNYTACGGRGRTCSFITSPHAGAPTRPVPTVVSALSIEPTFLGFS